MIGALLCPAHIIFVGGILVLAGGGAAYADATRPMADQPPPVSDTAAAPSFLRLNTVVPPGKKNKQPGLPEDMPPELTPEPVKPRMAPTMGLSVVPTSAAVTRHNTEIVAVPAASRQTAATTTIDILGSLDAAHLAVEWLTMIDHGNLAAVQKITRLPFSADGVVISAAAAQTDLFQGLSQDPQMRRVITGVQVTPLAIHMDEILMSNTVAALSLKTSDWLVVLDTVLVSVSDDPDLVTGRKNNGRYQSWSLLLHQEGNRGVKLWKIAGYVKQ